MICKKCKRTVKHPYGETRNTLTCGACRGIKTQIGRLRAQGGPHPLGPGGKPLRRMGKKSVYRD